MDAPNPSATPTFASRTPLHIGALGLRVRDLDRVTTFYRDVLGLAVLDRAKDATALGAGGVRFVHLEHRPNAEPDDPRSAGLYHTAFLMPTRGDLARAEAFYRDALGLDVTRRRQGATFMSSGRYHHHIAGNVWHSAGAGRRQEGRAGLSWLSLEAADAPAFETTKARLTQAGEE